MLYNSFKHVMSQDHSSNNPYPQVSPDKLNLSPRSAHPHQGMPS